MNPITQPYVEDYLKTLLPQRSGILNRLEQEAQNQKIPIITPEVASLMETLIKTTRSQYLLEVGTAIGYSAILFCYAAGPNCRLITIERDPHLIDTARCYIEEAGCSQQIKVMPGDATEILPCLTEPVDMIFLDGAKGHYHQMLEHCLKLLKPGGLLISDNVLFRGMVASDAMVKRRKKTIVTRMRNYLKTITSHPQLQTSLLPIGDGLAISLKLNETSSNL
ncbi:O-methyltransferase [Anoxynatronum buryatiense]|uniref:tRNA 5-hydroxyuridine methyltransferase n=1 Tax=Anoxynatronum buryatiense TaxID=489973 RepID=A0AA46AIC5_9CLOT|nr:O-methyltransferase [Anoxynatronum buryatiense]SMP48951.1 Predicted O-methyltransferase YrrM [Anoxynatronum buryatiense]